MQIRLIRHATLILELGGRRILVDPMLSDAGAMDPVQNAADERRIPLVPLPVPAGEVVAGIDAVLLTHMHRDHWDAAAADLLPRHLPLLCQPSDADRLRELGFTAVLPVDEALLWEGIEFARTGGKHGTGIIGMKMGKVSGFVLRAEGEPLCYIAGDTIWCGCVREALETFRPDVVVLNTGSAQYVTGGPITMDADDVARVCATVPTADVVAVHMDTVNHCWLTRERLAVELQRRDLSGRVRIPADGETLEWPRAVRR